MQPRQVSSVQEIVVRPASRAVTRFLQRPEAAYLCGLQQTANHPAARHLAVMSEEGQIVALASLVEHGPGSDQELAVVVVPACGAREIEQLLGAAACEGGPAARLSTCFTWGSEPTREVLERAGLVIAARASFDGISQVVLAPAVPAAVR